MINKFLFFVITFLVCYFNLYSQNGQVIEGLYFATPSNPPSRSSYVRPDIESRKQLIIEMNIEAERNRKEYLDFIEEAYSKLTDDKYSELYNKQIYALNNYINTFKEVEKNKDWAFVRKLLFSAREKYYKDLYGF